MCCFFMWDSVDFIPCCRFLCCFSCELGGLCCLLLILYSLCCCGDFIDISFIVVLIFNCAVTPAAADGSKLCLPFSTFLLGACCWIYHIRGGWRWIHCFMKEVDLCVVFFILTTLCCFLNLYPQSPNLLPNCILGRPKCHKWNYYNQFFLEF